MKRFLKIALSLAFAAMLASSAFAQITPPQGRLTLTINTPVMTADVVGASTLYYTPYIGNSLPISNGTTISNGTFSQLSLGVFSAGSIQSGLVADIYAYYTSGAYQLCYTEWGSNTARTPNAITQLQGFWVNAEAITCATAATVYTVPTKVAVYLGTVYSSNTPPPGGTIQGLTVSFKPNAAGNGTNNLIGIWNAYNRVPVYSLSRDSNTSWTYNSANWLELDDSNLNRVSWVDGLAESAVAASVSVQASTATTNSGINIGVDLDSTTAAPNIQGSMYPNAGATYFLKSPTENFDPQLGLHYIQAMQSAPSGVTDTFYGGGVVQTLTFQGEY